MLTFTLPGGSVNRKLVFCHIDQADELCNSIGLKANQKVD